MNFDSEFSIFLIVSQYKTGKESRPFPVWSFNIFSTLLQMENNMEWQEGRNYLTLQIHVWKIIDLLISSFEQTTCWKIPHLLKS